MDLQFGDVQETALIPLAIKASETVRPNARIKDIKAKEIIDTLGVDVSKFDPFLSHEGVVARTIMFRDELKRLISSYPDALCINLGCGFDDKFSQVDNGKIRWFDVDLPDQIAVRRIPRFWKNTEAIMMRSRIQMQRSDGEQIPGKSISNLSQDCHSCPKKAITRK